MSPHQLAPPSPPPSPTLSAYPLPCCSRTKNPELLLVVSDLAKDKEPKGQTSSTIMSGPKGRMAQKVQLILRGFVWICTFKMLPDVKAMYDEPIELAHPPIEAKDSETHNAVEDKERPVPHWSSCQQTTTATRSSALRPRPATPTTTVKSKNFNHPSQGNLT